MATFKRNEIVPGDEADDIWNRVRSALALGFSVEIRKSDAAAGRLVMITWMAEVAKLSEHTEL